MSLHLSISTLRIVGQLAISYKKKNILSDLWDEKSQLPFLLKAMVDASFSVIILLHFHDLIDYQLTNLQFPHKSQFGRRWCRS